MHFTVTVLLGNFNDFSCKAGDKSQKTSKVAECSSDSGSEHSIAKASGLAENRNCHRSSTSLTEVSSSAGTSGI